VNVEGELRLLAYTDSTEVGGAELALGYLLGALSPAIEVAVLATDAKVGAAIAAHRPGTALRAVRAPAGSADLAALREHLGAVRGFAPEVLHANQAWPWACAYGEVAGLFAPGVRVLAVDHLPAAAAMPRVRLLARRAIASRLDAHVAVGERAAREVEEIAGLRRGSVRAIANGVPSRSAAGPSAPGRGHGPGLVVGSLGRLTEQKGYDLLVAALPSLPAARVVLVGDGPERQALERLASELGVAERFRITGWKADARAELPSFDVFALPSRWEGMPLSILEAMHAGLPVLATDVGSIAEVVADGDTGFVVAPDDLPALRLRLGDLLADGELRGRMGERAHALAAERYTDAAMAGRYEALYRRMLSGVGAS